MVAKESFNKWCKLQSFSGVMFDKLLANSHKTSYLKENYLTLFNLLEEKVKELKEAVQYDFSYKDIEMEAADVANFAMFIADKAKYIHKLKMEDEMRRRELDGEKGEGDHLPSRGGNRKATQNEETKEQD